MTNESDTNRLSDPRALGRVIRDPIHDYVHLPLEFNRLLAHPYLQRLRRISQTSFSSSVYPSMTGSRFEHALGTMHLAGLAWDGMWANSAACANQLLDDVRDAATLEMANGKTVDSCTVEMLSKDRLPGALKLAVQTVALTHDVGHPPFSHALEGFYARHLEEITSAQWKVQKWDTCSPGSKRAMHERAGLIMFSQFGGPETESLPWWLSQVILDERFGWSQALHKLVSGPVDVDRLDYLLRDAHLSGTEFGSIDVKRLLDSFELHYIDDEWLLGFGIRATSAIETLFTNRLQYYRWVVFHPHTIAENRMLSQAIESAFVIAASEASLATSSAVPESDHASRTYGALNYFATDEVKPESNEIESLADVDDSTLWEILKSTRQSLNAKSVDELTDLEKRYKPLSLAVTKRRSNWAPVWKTDRDYAECAAKLVPGLRRGLEAYIVRIGQELGLEYPAGRVLAANVVARERAKEAVAMLHNGALSPTLALNQLMSRLLSKSKAMPVDTREQTLAHHLTQLTGDSLPTGFWIIGYEPIGVVGPAISETAAADNELLTTGVTMFQYEDRMDAGEVTSMFMSLDILAGAKPVFYAYYLVTTGETIRVGRRGLYSQAIYDEFVRILPQAVANAFASLAGAARNIV